MTHIVTPSLHCGSQNLGATECWEQKFLKRQRDALFAIQNHHRADFLRNVLHFGSQHLGETERPACSAVATASKFICTYMYELLSESHHTNKGVT